ncbi:unnamed protein product [Caenorhabditis angaria]|uniref:Secreted protein n=1 Tax=Caenorhabditis angaria TaxID=860376 RepID=A0A9P1ICA1_9PELO|nr:unnamed protein product [Caenorhabditis angaria]
MIFKILLAVLAFGAYFEQVQGGVLPVSSTEVAVIEKSLESSETSIDTLGSSRVKRSGCGCGCGCGCCCYAAAVVADVALAAEHVVAQDAALVVDLVVVDVDVDVEEDAEEDADVAEDVDVVDVVEEVVKEDHSKT